MNFSLPLSLAQLAGRQALIRSHWAYPIRWRCVHNGSNYDKCYFFFCLHIDVDWLCLRPRIEVMTREPHGRRVFEKIMNNCHWLAWIEILSMNEGIPLQKHREQKSITMNEFEWISYGPSVLAVATCGRLLIIIFCFFFVIANAEKWGAARILIPFQLSHHRRCHWSRWQMPAADLQSYWFIVYFFPYAIKVYRE